MLQASARMQADLTWKYYSDAKRNLDAAPGKGVEVFEPTPAILAASDAFVKGDLEVIEKQFTTDYGVKDAATKIAKVAELVDKWKRLTADIADDPEAIAKIYWNEIFSKVDAATFGMR